MSKKKRETISVIKERVKIVSYEERLRYQRYEELVDSTKETPESYLKSEIAELSAALCKHFYDRYDRVLEDDDPIKPILSQAVRASSSVGANYCEGRARVSPAGCVQYLRVARGSAYETMFWAKTVGSREIQDKALKLAKLVDSEIVATLKPEMERLKTLIDGHRQDKKDQTDDLDPEASHTPLA